MHKERTKRLVTYSAAAVAFLISRKEAAAQIIYHDIDPDFSFIQNEDSSYFFEPIDLDGDGTHEVVFAFSQYNSQATCTSLGSMFFSLINYASVLLDTDSAHIKVLGDSDVVSAEGNWNHYSLPLMASSVFSNNLCDTDEEYLDLYGNWLYADTKYIGLRFIKDSNTYYGWVRLSVSISEGPIHGMVDFILIYDYAYEQTPGKQITAGEGVPDILGLQNNQADELKLYPNPVHTNLTIQVPDATDYVLQITDMQGRLIRAQKTFNQKISLNVEGLAPGMYMAILSNEKTHHTIKFVKE